MTTTAGLQRADEPLEGVSRLDVATIIETLGGSIVEAYAFRPSDDGKSPRSGWGSKQREQVLRALINRVALNARETNNAALSATDAAIAKFARNAFKQEGGTRSPRDRAPITKNIDKVVGGWLRRLGRRLRQDAVTASMTGDVRVRGRRGKFRLTLTFAYPWRLVADRRLRIAAHVEEFTESGVRRPIPVPADPLAPAVTLPENRRRYSREELAVVRQNFESLKATAALLNDPELAAFADEGFRTFVRLSAVKVLLAVFLSLAVGAVASPPGQRMVARFVDAIVSSGSLRELLEKLRVDQKEGVFVAPDGAQSQVAQSGSGSEIHLSPGPSPELLHIEASITGKDLSELREQLVPLGELGRDGVNAFQYRAAPHDPIVPWVIEVAVVPEQDAELAAELARHKASASITYDPPIAKAEMTRMTTLSLSGTRINLVSELREFPHKKESYAVTATVVRERGAPQVFRAQLRLDENGFATLQRDRGKPITPVAEDVQVGHPICTTLLHAQSMPMDLFNQRDYVRALARLHEEQKVMLDVYPPSTSPDVREMTVDWGDGDKANHEVDQPLFLTTHTYRVGNRAYPITIYFKGSEVVYKFDLYVFQSSGRAQDGAVRDYVTPYPPNPEVTQLAELGWNEHKITAIHRRGTVVTESISWSLHQDDCVWKVPLDFAVNERVKVRYFLRDREVVNLPAIGRMRLPTAR